MARGDVNGALPPGLWDGEDASSKRLMTQRVGGFEMSDASGTNIVAGLVLHLASHSKVLCSLSPWLLQLEHLEGAAPQGSISVTQLCLISVD